MDESLPLELASGTGLGAAIALLGIGGEIDWPPDHLVESAWLEHIPFAFWLIKALQPTSFVELGTHTGVSYFSICQAVQRLGVGSRCYAVDTWTGDPQTGAYGEEVFTAVSSLNERRYRSFSSLLRMTFDEGRKHFAEGEIDLLHIDGYHTYEAVLGDFRTWRDALSARAVVLFHGTNVRRDNFGVWRLWNGLRRDYPCFEFIHGSGLGVLAIGMELPEPIRNLFATNSSAVAVNGIRRIFAIRGEAIRGQFLYREAKTELARVQEAIDLAWQQREQVERELVIASSALARGRLEAANAAADFARFRHDSEQLEREVTQLRAERHIIFKSTSWRITRPLRGAMRLARGEPAAWARVRTMIRSRVEAPQAPEAILPGPAAPIAPASPFERTGPTELLFQRFPHIFSQFPVFPSPDRERRVTMLTDSIASNSLFGGVGTAIILAVLLAQRLGARLRIATRMEMLALSTLDHVMTAHGIKWGGNVEFLQCGPTARPMAMGRAEIILTTSWWGTASALRTIAAERIFYLIQEDERRYYPFGDERLWCSELLNDSRLRFIVNTHMLHKYFAAEGIKSIGERGVAFEPAFPETMYQRNQERSGSRRNFLFCARPHHPCNLFYRGLQAISAAIEQGLLPPNLWDFHLVGRDIPHVELPLGIVPTIHDTVSWTEYAALIRCTDLGLSLNATPYPSCPPLDLAASGAVVVTNRDGAKAALAHYSANILCVEPSLDALVSALGEGATLSQDESRRAANYAANTITRDWNVAFQEVLDYIAAQIS
jgi:hypothetical protein